MMYKYNLSVDSHVCRVPIFTSKTVIYNDISVIDMHKVLLFITMDCTTLGLWNFVTLSELNARYDSILLKIVSFCTIKMRDSWELQSTSETAHWVKKVNKV